MIEYFLEKNKVYSYSRSDKHKYDIFVIDNKVYSYKSIANTIDKFIIVWILSENDISNLSRYNTDNLLCYHFYNLSGFSIIGDSKEYYKEIKDYSIIYKDQIKLMHETILSLSNLFLSYNSSINKKTSKNIGIVNI